MVRRVGSYELLRQVSEEARVLVFEALCGRTARRVWLRVLKGEWLSDERARAQFHREARALMLIVHRNVIAVSDYSGKEAKEPFIATEIIDGETVGQLIVKHGALPAGPAVFAQMASAVCAAHKEGLVHRKLVPESFYVERSGRVVLSDFSLVGGSSVTTSDTFISNQTAIVASSPFVAPEVVKGMPPDARSDLYSLGTVALYTLLGGPPETAKTGDAVDGELMAIIAKLRAVDPNERPRNIDTLIHEWRRDQASAEDEVAAWLEPKRPAAPEPRAPSDPKAAFISATHGRYEVKALLGEGGMGKVYSARDKKLERDVAVKVITGAVDDEQRRRFHREARAMGKLRHPNIIEVLDYSGQDAAVPYLVLELIDGVTLGAIMATAPAPETAALCVALEISHALERVHDEGFVHRDLKPDNIFVDALGRVVLADFGIVRAAVPKQGATFQVIGARYSLGTASIGSPYYASPEQLFDPNAAGPQSDLFSLGSVVQAILTQQLPFEAKHVGEVLSKLTSGEFNPLPAGTTLEMKTLLSDLHEQEPSARPKGAHEVTQRIEALLAARKVTDTKRELRRFLGLEMDSAQQTYARAKDRMEDAKTGAKTVVLPKHDVTMVLPRGPSRLPWIIAALAVGLSMAAFAALFYR